MIEVKQAIRSAFNFLKDIYKPVPHGLLLEEVASGDKVWRITLGFDRPLHSTPLRKAMGIRADREYKIFEVDKKTGEVRSMKIRRVESVE